MMICFENAHYSQQIVNSIYLTFKENTTFEKKVLIITLDNVYIFDF